MILIQTGIESHVAHFWYADVDVKRRLCDAIIGRPHHRGNCANCEDCKAIYVDDITGGRPTLELISTYDKLIKAAAQAMGVGVSA